MHQVRHMWSTTYESKSTFCRSIRQAQSNRAAESTQIQKRRSKMIYTSNFTCAEPNN